MRRGVNFNQFWEEYFQSENRNLLYVLGRGFDPRMCAGLEAILKSGGSGVRNCLLIEFDEGPNSSSTRHAPLVSKNISKLNGMLQDRGNLLPKQVKMWSDEGPVRHRIGSRSAAEVFSDKSDFEPYTDIVIDISAMPRSIYLPLIGKTLFLIDRAKENNSIKPIPNLHIVVAEDAKLDRRIRDDGIDDNASYIHGFGSDLEMEATAGIPKIWMPILGEEQAAQLERIYNLINPDEVCPVLPFPSINPRRGDELLVEYRELLFDQWRVEPRNIIYASEQNPFETYRQIHQAVCLYNKVLSPLSGCKTVVSAMSSKLLSIGALLSAYELGVKMSVGIANIEAQGYNMDDNVTSEEELFTLWLAGDCYDP